MTSSVLVAFVDALGPDQLAAMGNAVSFAPHRRSLGGILGYSCGALPTILTGTPPSRHGRMCLFSRRSAESSAPLSPLVWLGLLPRILHERAPFRRALARLVTAASGLTGYLALYRVPPEAFAWVDVPEREDLFTARAIGGARTFLSEARDAGLEVHSADWRLPEDARWTESLAALRRGPDLAFVYAPEMDGALHTAGNGSAAAIAAAARIGDRIARAQDTLARAGRDVTTIVVGDHGMADVRRVIDPRPIVARLAARFFVDSTMLRVWGTRAELDAARIATDRARAPGRWLEADDLVARDAPTQGAPFGDAIFVLDEGALFAPSFAGGAVSGMHGYDLGSPSSHAAIASDDDAVLACNRLTDVAGVVRRKLGLGAEVAHA